MRSEPHPESRARRRISPEEVAARIVVRVAELRVSAAKTALRYARMETDAALTALWRAWDDYAAH